MTYGRIGLVLVSAVSLAGVALPQTVVAASKHIESDQIQVSLAVPDRRVIVVDASGAIQQLYSNTENSVTPVVVAGTFTGPKVPLTPKLEDQFDELMGQIHANHVVSVRAHATPETSLQYPDFSQVKGPQEFTVTPSAVATDEDTTPYEISLN